MAYQGYDPAPLFPASVKAWLEGWLFRALGLAVLVGCIATAASLISWTAIDPILARATGTAARNLMGAPGAIVSDVIMQMTGLAGTFALLPPLFWALHLLTIGRPPVGLRLKLALAPLAVLCMAIALSSLPMLQTSPLHHGYGGLLGDTGLVFIAGMLAKVNPERAWAAAGLFCFAGGTFVLMRSVGLTQQDLKAICQAAPQVRLPRVNLPNIRWPEAMKLPRREPVFTAPPPRARDPVLREPPAFEAPRARVMEEAPLPPLGMRARAPEPDYADSGRGMTFDQFTDRSSEEIARRFAPGAVATAPRVFAVADETPADHSLEPVAPAPRPVEATFVRSSPGPLKRAQPPRGMAPPDSPRQQMPFSDLLESAAFRSSDATLPIALGRDPSGAPVVADLARMPNLLIASAISAEKSSGINAVILSLLHRHAPDRCRLMLIAPHRPDLAIYEGVPHLLGPVVTDAHNGLAALEWIAAEMHKRLARMARLGVGNIDVFNNRVGRTSRQAEVATHDRASPDETGPLPHIVVVVDELSELARASRYKLERLVERLDKRARAAGIHLVMATDRPTAEVVTPVIKRAFQTRIAFKLGSAAESCTVLEIPGADLLGATGDMLYWSGSDRILRLGGSLVSDDDVSAVIASLRGQRGPRYV